MKQEQQRHPSIVIGNKGNEIRISFFVILTTSFLFGGIIASLLHQTYSLSLFITIGIAVVLILLNVILWTGFLSTSVRYIEIYDEWIVLADSSKLLMELQGLSNIVFHTHFDVVNVQLHFEDIEKIILYAIEDNRVGRMFGDPGYCLRLRIITKDGTSLVIKDWFDYPNTKFEEGINYLSSHGVKIVDRQHLMEIIKAQGSITESLNRRTSK